MPKSSSAPVNTCQGVQARLSACAQKYLFRLCDLGCSGRYPCLLRRVPASRRVWGTPLSFFTLVRSALVRCQSFSILAVPCHQPSSLPPFASPSPFFIFFYFYFCSTELLRAWDSLALPISPGLGCSLSICPYSTMMLSTLRVATRQAAALRPAARNLAAYRAVSTWHTVPQGPPVGHR